MTFTLPLLSRTPILNGAVTGGPLAGNQKAPVESELTFEDCLVFGFQSQISALPAPWDAVLFV